MNSTGCGFLVLASLALLIGLVPFLAWTNLVIALPLGLIGMVAAATSARKPAAQGTDKAMFWVALALIAVIILRTVIF